MGAKQFISGVPVPVCGLALGLAALDRFLYSDIHYYNHNILALFAVALIALFTLRLATDLPGIRRDLENPAVFGIFPTYPMAIMVLSATAREYVGDIALAVWSGAIVFNFVLIYFFAKRFLRRPSLRDVFPSWTVMFTGYVIASTTSPAFGTEAVGQILFWFGFVAYLTVLPVILWRVLRMGLPKDLVPQLAIFAGPVNLCVVGCIRSYDYAPPGIPLAILSVLGVISYAAVILYMPVMLNRKFYPSFSAFTFPLVISSISIYEYGKLHGFSSMYAFEIIQAATLAIAVISVLHVLIRYMIYFYRTARAALSVPHREAHFRQAPPDPE
ncbi:MAG: TDT family transporter [Methanomassiliicoccaceae archaeon]|jgi:exfoliative toxin A/B|nr:TDT family transporter [Methanomassiliicoccaceae archaeon]